MRARGDREDRREVKSTVNNHREDGWKTGQLLLEERDVIAVGSVGLGKDCLRIIKIVKYWIRKIHSPI